MLLIADEEVMVGNQEAGDAMLVNTVPMSIEQGMGASVDEDYRRYENTADYSLADSRVGMKEHVRTI